MASTAHVGSIKHSIAVSLLAIALFKDAESATPNQGYFFSEL